MNLIEIEYIRIWYKLNRSNKYITVDHICNEYQLYNNSIIYSFFKCYNNKIYLDTFLQFALLFSVTSVSHLLLCLFSVFNIQSDNDIEIEDIIKFYCNIDPKEKYLDDVKNWINETVKYDTTVPFSEFYKYVCNNPELIHPILHIKKKVTSFIFTKDIRKNITYRYKHINDILNYQQTHNGILPPEKCFSRIKRLFTKLPNPYYYNWLPSPFTTKDILISLYRMNYGYSPPSNKLHIMYKQGTKCSSHSRNDRHRVIKVSSLVFSRKHSKKATEIIKMKSVYLTPLKRNSISPEEKSKIIELTGSNGEYCLEIDKLPKLQYTNSTEKCRNIM